MQVKRAIIFGTMGNKTEQKAVVLLMLLKHRLDKTSSISNASQNKIASILNVSPSTVKRYLPVWEKMGLVEWRGKKGDVFVVKKISSSTKHRNFDMKRLDFKCFKNLYQTFRSFLFLIANSRKEFVKRLIRIANQPKKGEDFKKARKNCNKYAKQTKGDDGFVYHEYGFSLKGIGRILGFCSRTVEDIVKLAINKKWCNKERHYEWMKLPGVNRMFVEGYTFTTMNYGCVVSANTYPMSRAILMAIIGGKK